MTVPIAMMVRTPILLVLLLIAGAVLLVGVVGAVLLVVGLVKKRTALWVCGLVAMVLAGLALLVGVPVGVLLCWRVASHEARLSHPPAAVRALPDGSGCSIRHEGRRVTARVEGVEIEVLEPGSGRASTSSRTTSGVLPGSSETRHEIGIGNVEIVVEKRDGRLSMTLSVNGRDYSPIFPCDRIVITESRDVLVNGQRRLP